MRHVCSNGATVKGERLYHALKKVAQFYRDNAKKVYEDDPYASHVTEEEKLEILKSWNNFADEIENGNPYGFSVWQRVEYELTGVCVPFL